MAFPHPTDDALWLEDGAETYAPATTIVAGIFGPKSASVTLSGGDKTATHAAADAFHMARGPVALTGEVYLEFTINAVPTPTDSTTGFGLVNGAVNLDTYAEPDRFFSYRRSTHHGEADYGRQLSAIAIPG